MGLLKENFMLTTPSALTLYEKFAKDMPIYDYHCHLSAQEIADDRLFNSITDVWLAGDHYKWRAMRALGINERYITGEASDKDKFLTWIKCVPSLIGNPLYHWTHLELARYFDYHEAVKVVDAEKIWAHCQAKIATGAFSARQLIVKSNVKVICTIDDPLDDLTHHRRIAQDTSFPVTVLPTFRPDQLFHVHKETFVSYVERFTNKSSEDITLTDLMLAIDKQIERFQDYGCRLADHGLSEFKYIYSEKEEVETILGKILQKCPVSFEEVQKYTSYVLCHLGTRYTEKGWAMQLHLGALRNNNESAYQSIGPDAGFDSLSDQSFAETLNLFFDQLNKKEALPRTIVFPLNPVGQESVITALGNFQSDDQKGKMQFGTAWWFNDHKDGMILQMKNLASYGVISTFIGMLTDSRSFLSYTRHEYFRRILCDVFGRWMEEGEITSDFDEVGSIITDICYDNAVNYFTIDLKED